MSKHNTVVWYICEECKRPVMWIYRMAHKDVCKDCKEGEGRNWSK